MRKLNQKRKYALPLGETIKIGDIFGDDRKSLNKFVERSRRRA